MPRAAPERESRYEHTIAVRFFPPLPRNSLYIVAVSHIVKFKRSKSFSLSDKTSNSIVEVQSVFVFVFFWICFILQTWPLSCILVDLQHSHISHGVTTTYSRICRRATVKTRRLFVRFVIYERERNCERRWTMIYEQGINCG